MQKRPHFPACQDRLRRVGNPILKVMDHPLVEIQFHRHSGNIESLEVTLSEAQLARLDEASAIVHGYPHDFLAREGVRGSVYGGMHDRIADPRLA